MKAERLILRFLIDTLSSLHSIYKIIRYSSFGIRLNQLEVKKDRCLILGNGPSLVDDIQKHSHLIEDCEVVVVNSFSTSNLFEVYKPKYYVIADPAFNKTTNPLNLQEKIDFTFDCLVKKTSWDMVLFFPNGISKHLSSLFESNPFITVREYNAIDVEGFVGFKHFCYKRNLGMPRPQNVLIASIFIALNLSFNRIYLLGADHSWLRTIVVDIHNRVCLSDHHFYDKDSTSVGPIPWLKGNGEHFTMPTLLRTLALTFDSYFELKYYSDSINAKVFNFSDSSYIDAFKRSEVTNSDFV